MKDILIIAHFTQILSEGGNSRFSYIANLLAKENNVELVTSSYSHRNKEQRVVDTSNKHRLNYKLTQLSEKGYRKNVSLKRFYSHYFYGRNLKKYLDNRKKPDVIYCAIPSLDAASVAANYAKNNDIRLIIDVQDLWPEAFKMVFNSKYISDLVFYPFTRKANQIYRNADVILAVSKTYLKFALSNNNKVIDGHVIYLGTELEHYDSLSIKHKIFNKPENEIWVAYIGTLGHSYDIPSVIDALESVAVKTKENIKFLIMGDGPMRIDFEKYAENKNLNIHFTGRLEYGEMIGYLNECDIAVNPIVSGSAGSIINKVADYAAAGLPVINTQESKEYRELINEYNCGLNCENGNILDIEEKFLKLIENSEIRNLMGNNNRLLAIEKFDRKYTYKIIREIVST